MRVQGLDRQMSNLADFKSAIKRYGFSINNFYDVKFEISSSSPLFAELSSQAELTPSLTNSLMTLYTDEASLPGVQISTGEYRINNSPTLKYAYGSVFSEAQFSFIMDADSRIKSIFDVWTNWIYGYSTRVKRIGPFIQSSPKLRTRYRDDYAIDIVIIKYERSMSSDLNAPRDDQSAFSIKDIIPGTNKNEVSKFYKAVPTYAVRLFKAFPSNISSISLNSGTSELTKMSVTFEYETMTTSVLNDNKISGDVTDPINGGTELFEIFNA